MTEEYIIAIDGEWVGKYVTVNSQRVYAVKHYKSYIKAKDALWRLVDRDSKKHSVFEIYKCWGAEPHERQLIYFCSINTIEDYNSITNYP